MQSWDGGALRGIKAQVWDALVLGLMEQGGDASQHSGEKRGKSPNFGENSWFFFIFSFTLLSLNPYFTSFSPKKTFGFFKASLFFRRKGCYFQIPLGQCRA